jgi:hypothetical protein
MSAILPVAANTCRFEPSQYIEAKIRLQWTAAGGGGRPAHLLRHQALLYHRLE